MPATVDNTSRWFSISMFLLGVILAGAAGVLRGDWLGERAANAVEHRVEGRLERMENRLNKRLDEILDEVKSTQ